jgi:integrase
MKYAVKDINKLIENIRSGNPPELPEGTREQHYYDPALPGFYIRLLNTGVASWVVQWKRLGRQKKITLGDVKVLDRDRAIKAGRELLAKITLGMLDPHEARRERMRANKVTFTTVADLFLKHRKAKGDLRPNSAEQFKRYLTGYYFQHLHRLPIDEITQEQIQTRVDHTAIQSGKRAAHHCCVVMRVLFKWALTKGYLPQGHPNPMTNVESPKQNGPRERVLTDDEIRLIWKTCEGWEAEAIRYEEIRASIGGKRPWSGSPPITDHARGIMLLFLTGCRAQEIGDLQWSEVDLDNGELFIPKTRTKNEEDLPNPLADWAVQILLRVKRQPGRNGVFAQTHRDGRNMHHADRGLNRRIAKAGGIPPKGWTLHDIRRTFRTRMSGLGVTRDVAEALVGHVSHRTQMDRVYDKYEHWPEKRQALAMWEANLRAIIDGTAEKIAHPRFGKKGDAA